jgi:hypothetical protein
VTARARRLKIVRYAAESRSVGRGAIQMRMLAFTAGCRYLVADAALRSIPLSNSSWADERVEDEPNGER